jgi:formiminoglutamase
MGAPDWLTTVQGDVPLIVSMPHTGTQIAPEIVPHLVSPWRARRDADWWVDRLYDFAPMLGATFIRTDISRTVIDANRDPSGKSLYPGQNTTELCPSTTFDGEPLYLEGHAPDEAEIVDRRRRYFDPYHAALAQQIARLLSVHDKIVLFDAHSIRSRIPRLFDGELPHLNIGTNSGLSCAAALTVSVEAVCDASDFSRVTNGRFRGGYTTRHYGEPGKGIHAIQLELACRGYMEEPEQVSHENWPTPYDPVRAGALRALLERILVACLNFAVKDLP